MVIVFVNVSSCFLYTNIKQCKLILILISFQFFSFTQQTQFFPIKYIKYVIVLIHFQKGISNK